MLWLLLIRFVRCGCRYGAPARCDQRGNRCPALPIGPCLIVLRVANAQAQLAEAAETRAFNDTGDAQMTSVDGVVAGSASSTAGSSEAETGGDTASSKKVRLRSLSGGLPVCAALALPDTPGRFTHCSVSLQPKRGKKGGAAGSGAGSSIEMQAVPTVASPPASPLAAGAGEDAQLAAAKDQRSKSLAKLLEDE